MLAVSESVISFMQAGSILNLCDTSLASLERHSSQKFVAWLDKIYLLGY